MDEPRLQELQARIDRLERALSDVRRELTPLKTKLDDLGTAFEINLRSSGSHFNSIYDYIRNINDQLWPLVHKMFPGSKNTQRQIASLIKSDGKSSDKQGRC